MGGRGRVARRNGAKGKRKDELEWSNTFVQNESGLSIEIPLSGFPPFFIKTVIFPLSSFLHSSSSLFVSEIRKEISSLRSNPAKAIGGLGAIVGALEGGSGGGGSSKFDAKLFSY